MLTSVDKAIAAGVVSLLCNVAANYFHIIVPDDVKTAIAALIVAGVVWATPNKQVPQ